MAGDRVASRVGVVWSKSTSQKFLASQWDPLEAWETKAECEQGKARHTLDQREFWLSRGAEVSVLTKGLFVKDKSDTWLFEFICFPDTIDPRGKGEGQ